MFSLTALGSTIANSRPIQYMIGAGALIIGFMWWLVRHDQNIRKSERYRAERRARKTVTRIRERQDEISEQVEVARRGAPSVSHADQLPDDTRARIFND